MRFVDHVRSQKLPNIEIGDTIFLKDRLDRYSGHVSLVLNVEHDQLSTMNFFMMIYVRDSIYGFRVMNEFSLKSYNFTLVGC